MATVLKVSDAASIGLHAAVLLAANPGRPVATRRMASALRVSRSHLSKVLGDLVKSGIVESTRGPKGGFSLRPGGEKTPLLEVYEVIEGRLKPRDCLLATRICGGRDCIFGGLLKRLNREVRGHLRDTTLAAAARKLRTKRRR